MSQTSKHSRLRRQVRVWWKRRSTSVPRRSLVPSIAVLALAAAGLVTWQVAVLIGVAVSGEAQAISATQSLVVTGGGIIALILAAWRSFTARRQADIANNQARTAARQAEAAEYGRRTDRYTTGVRMLGDELMMIRMGGLDLLAQLSRDDPERFGRAVCDTLAAFVRHPPHDTAGQRVVQAWNGDIEMAPDDDESEDSPQALTYRLRPDVNEAVVRLGGLAEDLHRRQGFPTRYRPNLSEADLRGLQADGACLWRIDFTRARLTNAQLTGATAQWVQFSQTDLRGANLSRADLTGSFILRVLAADADLSRANLERSFISSFDALRLAKGAHVSGAAINIPTGGARGTEAILQGLWAWRDKPPHLNGPKGNAGGVSLYDEELRPGWRNREPFPWRADFGPPDEARPLNADNES